MRCPTIEEIQQFQAGICEDQFGVRIVEHFETCDSCRSQADTLGPHDSMATAVFSLAAAELPDCGHLIQRIQTELSDSPTNHPQRGDQFGDFEIISKLGEGGMGVVLLAKERSLDRLVALKLLCERNTSHDQRSRFLTEAKALASVESDNVVPVYRVGDKDGTPYLAMQYLRGISLKDRLSQDRLSSNEFQDIAVQILHGLAAIHSVGLVHRDLKPANIWIEESGRVRILDLGLAGKAVTGTGLTEIGTLLGTPRYMSPEQARGLAVDQRSDIFSLGSVLYEMATGVFAIAGDNVADILAFLTSGHPETSQLANDFGKERAALIELMLQKDVKRRPKDVLEVLKTLVSTQAKTNADTNVVPASQQPLSQWIKNQSAGKFAAIASAVVAATYLIMSQIILTLGSGDAIVQLVIDQGKIPVPVNVNSQQVITITDPNDGSQLSIAVDTDQNVLNVRKQGFALSTASFESALANGRKISVTLLPQPKPTIPSGTNKDSQQDDIRVGTKELLADFLPAFNWPDATSHVVIPFDAANAQQQAAITRQVPVQVKSKTGMTLRLIPAGEFQMGLDPTIARRELSSDNAASGDARGELFPHRVVITKAFYAGVNEVTNREFSEIVPDHLCAILAQDPQQTNQPASGVTWHEAIQFCNALSILENLVPCYQVGDGHTGFDRNANGYRLPTEAEWEYIFRCGSPDLYPFSLAESAEHAWFLDNSDGRIHNVSQKKANGFGLHDLGGNVWEWCFDWCSESYYRLFVNGVAVDPTGPPTGRRRITRGSDRKYEGEFLRSSMRSRLEPHRQGPTVGFRVLRNCPRPKR